MDARARVAQARAVGPRHDRKLIRKAIRSCYDSSADIPANRFHSKTGEYVSDIEPLAGSSDPASTYDVLLEPGAADAPRPDREGLPRGYRMRADRHYVDHLASSSAGQPVRMLALDQIASSESCETAGLRPLIESIRMHGLVQPLLVRRRDPGYAVIAGHKRLAAARCLRLPTIPCLVHHVDDAQAALLAVADNLRAGAAEPPDTAGDLAAAARRAIGDHLDVVRSSLALVRTSPPHLARAAIDLAAAHSWRAARLTEIVDAIAGAARPAGRARSLGTVIDRVVDGFASEGRLNGAGVCAGVEGAAAAVMVDEQDVSLIVSSGVLATIPIVEQSPADRPAVLVRAVAAAPGSVRISIDQDAAQVPAWLAGRFFDETSSDRPGGWCAVACAVALEAAAERAGGTAAFRVDANGHSSLTVQFPHR
jgi:hypothetical protein